MLFIKNCKDRQATTKDQDNAKFKPYVDPIRIMIEKEEATKEQIGQAYLFLNHENGEFWKSNVLSTATLRKNMTKILLKRNEPKKPNFK